MKEKKREEEESPHVKEVNESTKSKKEVCLLGLKEKVSSFFLGCWEKEMGIGASVSVAERSVHQFTVKDSSGKDVNLSDYQGKVLLIVNVASKCGFTESNYTQLTELYQKYKNQGFEILAFPCNQFLNQEPDTSQEAHQFACTRFKAEYPVFQKVRVNGPNAAPLYKFLKASKPSFFGSRVKWNFSKFLVAKNGVVIDRYGPMASPAIEKDIKKALEQP